MAQEKDQKRPRRGRRTFGLIVAGAVATAPSLGCEESSTNPAPDTGVAVVMMDAAAPMNVVTPDAAAPVDTAAPADAAPAAADTATAVDTAMAMDTASAMDGMTNSDGGADARDADIDVYPPSTRG